MDQAFLAVGLAEHPLSTMQPRAVLLVVGRLLVRQHIAQGSVGTEIEPPNLAIDLADRTKLAGAIDVGLDVDRWQTLGELADFQRPVILLDVLARSRDREQIEQFEIVESEHVEQTRWRPIIFQREPSVELELRLSRGRLDARDLVPRERGVVALGDERDLILEVGEAVVNRRGREHQHARFHSSLDDVAHQAVVTGLAILVSGLVAEVVRFVDHDEIVIAPVDVREIDFPGVAALAGQVSVIEHVVMKAVGGKAVAAIVGFVQRPVVAQPLRHEDQHAIVAQLVVFDDRQGLEGLTEAHAVGDDASAVAFELVDCSHNTIALELEELLPDNSAANPGGGFYDAFLIQLVAKVFEEMKQDQEVNERRGFVSGQLAQVCQKCVLRVGCGGQAIPKRIEPAPEYRAFIAGFRALNQTESVAGSQTETIGGEWAMPGQHASRHTGAIADSEKRLRQRHRRATKIDLLLDPRRELPGERSGVQPVTKRPIGVGAE
ncbi:MAG TPA: hypothetical protein VMV27_13640 [Candidatus Binataceae bacterium]|nr:hypothetical protein [Candidatus Binataceae bacterium]